MKYFLHALSEKKKITEDFIWFIHISWENKMCLWNTMLPVVTTRFEKTIFRKVKVTDLGVTGKGINSRVCMPNMNSIYDRSKVLMKVKVDNN